MPAHSAQRGPVLAPSHLKLEPPRMRAWARRPWLHLEGPDDGPDVVPHDARVPRTRAKAPSYRDLVASVPELALQRDQIGVTAVALSSGHHTLRA